eukprot:IDg4044t1
MTRLAVDVDLRRNAEAMKPIEEQFLNVQREEQLYLKSLDLLQVQDELLDEEDNDRVNEEKEASENVIITIRRIAVRTGKAEASNLIQALRNEKFSLSVFRDICGTVADCQAVLDCVLHTTAASNSFSKEVCAWKGRSSTRFL